MGQETIQKAVDLAWRPRYTPVLGVLMTGAQSIEAIAQEIGISHSAVSQTVTQMVKNELVMLKPGGAASAQDETAPRVIPKT